MAIINKNQFWKQYQIYIERKKATIFYMIEYRNGFLSLDLVLKKNDTIRKLRNENKQDRKIKIITLESKI